MQIRNDQYYYIGILTLMLAQWCHTLIILLYAYMNLQCPLSVMQQWALTVGIIYLLAQKNAILYSVTAVTFQNMIYPQCCIYFLSKRLCVVNGTSHKRPTEPRLDPSKEEAYSFRCRILKLILQACKFYHCPFHRFFLLNLFKSNKNK